MNLRSTTARKPHVRKEYTHPFTRKVNDRILTHIFFIMGVSVYHARPHTNPPQRSNHKHQCKDRKKQNGLSSVRTLFKVPEIHGLE